MADVNLKSLLETGVHFGHRTRKWNPLMKSYIFTERNGIHIIDLQKTLEAFHRASALISDSVVKGGTILFVGTKRQAQETIELEATRCGMPYVNSRWLGGTLTNWKTIRSRIIELENLEKRRDEGEFALFTKKESLTMSRQIDRLQERLGGIRTMKGLPSLVFIVDVRREETGIHEANLLNIPVIAMVDTNCDPRGVDYVIPSNDDAIRAIKLITSKIADSVLEGLALRKDVEEEIGVAGGALPALEHYEMSDEDLLGEATLAKLKSGDYDEKYRFGYADEEKGEGVSEDLERIAGKFDELVEDEEPEEIALEPVTEDINLDEALLTDDEPMDFEDEDELDDEDEK